MVATDAPGCREVVLAGKTGLLVPIDDTAALAAAIAVLAKDAGLRARYGLAARALAEERFSADAIGRAVTELYLRLVRPHG
jgi:glycosyltransferase involved in cell wall biosynthesis